MTSRNKQGIPTQETGVTRPKYHATKIELRTWKNMDGELNPNTHWEVIFVIYANIHFKINEYGYYKTQTFGLN
jgi:hypothetical protein